VPKRIFARPDLERAPNGKANYALIREYAQQRMAGAQSDRAASQSAG
jgi:hypothetical protein